MKISPTPASIRRKEAAMMKLPKIKDARIDEIENAGCDEGRFFVHLKDGYDWAIDPFEVRQSTTFGSRAEVIKALKRVKKVEAEAMTKKNRTRRTQIIAELCRLSRNGWAHAKPCACLSARQQKGSPVEIPKD